MIKKPSLLQASVDDFIQERESMSEETDPGLLAQTNSAMSNGNGGVDKALILDVLEHMKKNNSYQKQSNKNQIDANNRMAFLSKALLAIVVMTAISLVDSIIGRFQYNTAVSKLSALAGDYKKLQDQYDKLATKVDNKLATKDDSKALTKKVENLTAKVDDAPKVVADSKGELSLEVSMKKADVPTKETNPIKGSKELPKPAASTKKDSEKATIPLKGF